MVQVAENSQAFCRSSLTINSIVGRCRNALTTSMILVLAAMLSVMFTASIRAESAEPGVNLFILSGQSNMAGLKPEESFTPAVEKAFGKQNVIVVKDALGGQPIRRWYKDWKSADGSRPDSTGDLYDRLMMKVKAAIKGKEISTVTFIWMQGERDANEKNGEIYAASLQGLFGQLSTDLGRKDLNFVVGRLSDFDLQNKRYPHWTLVREQQVALADGHPRCVWVDTDDLNDGKNRSGKTIKNDLHYSADGYVKLGQRFADSAIKMLESTKNQVSEKRGNP